MRAGDEEATKGLDRAKANALKKPDGDAKVVYAPPKLVSDQPVPAPTRPSKTGMQAAAVTRGSRPPSAAPASAVPVTRPSAPPPAANNASTTVQTQVRPPSKPPPLPPKARSTPPGKTKDAADSIATNTLRGVGGGRNPDSALDNGPTGTSLPDDNTGETAVRDDRAPSTADAGDITSSHNVHPHTIREAGIPGGQRARLTTDPSIVTTTDSAAPAPLTVRGDADADDPTGSSSVSADILESTHSRPQDEEEIVIADDLAEIVDDSNKNLADENTDAGSGTIPPYRSEG
jgi:hypothetical protein